MEMLGKNEVTVSDRGLRHGLLVERFAQPNSDERRTHQGSVRLVNARPLSAAGESPPVQIMTPSL